MGKCKNCGKELARKEKLGTSLALKMLSGVGDKEALKGLCGQCLGNYLATAQEAYKKVEVQTT